MENIIPYCKPMQEDNSGADRKQNPIFSDASFFGPEIISPMS
jgi:hypothetical protein